MKQKTAPSDKLDKDSGAKSTPKKQKNGSDKTTPAAEKNTSETVTLTVTPVQEVTEEQNPIQNQPADNRLEYGSEIKKIILTGGTLQLSKAEKDILYAPFEDKEISIKGDGSLYITWYRFSDRLTNAFGGTGWVMIPEGMPKENKSIVYWGFHLVIKGIYCGFAIGEMQYFQNGRMTYGEACEGAKSNSLVRLCKSIGMGTKLWDKAFCDAWIEKYAVFEWKNNKDNKRVREYRLKTEPASKKPDGPPGAPVNNNPQPEVEKTEPVIINPVITTNPVETKNTVKKEGVSTSPATKNEKAIPDHELTKLESYRKQILTCVDRDKLNIIYKTVQNDWLTGHLLDNEKEELRIIANQRAVELERE